MKRKIKDIFNFGHYLQLSWLPIGMTLQIWVGGWKGWIVNFVGITILLINGIWISRNIK